MLQHRCRGDHPGRPITRVANPGMVYVANPGMVYGPAQCFVPFPFWFFLFLFLVFSTFVFIRNCKFQNLEIFKFECFPFLYFKTMNILKFEQALNLNFFSKTKLFRI
jgi:hypothetical protein